MELLSANPNVHVTCVEQSARMIEVAKRQIRNRELSESRVTFFRGNALNVLPSAGEVHDLVVTHFFLDCFQSHEIDALVKKVSSRATDHARWLLADFRLPERGWRKWRAYVVLALMYRFFRWTTELSASCLIPPDAFLEAAGFSLVKRRFANFGLIHSDLWLRKSA